MAVISAFLAGEVLAQINNPNVDPNSFNNALPTIDLGYSAFAAPASGLLVNQQPLTLQTRVINAYLMHTFEADFYHTIWTIPKTLDFGFVPSPVTRSFYMWNAYRVTQNLTTITATDATGLTLDPDDAPDTYLPDEVREYTLTATPDGPPQIDATYSYDFDGELATLSVTGIRVVGWTVEPNWIEPIMQRPAWLTDLQRSYNGTEQRRQLRDAPRVEWEFTFDVSESERQLLDNTLFTSGGRIFALPIWPDLRYLQAALSAGATSIAIDTAGTDFHAGGLGILLGADSRFEAFPIESVAAGELVLAADIEQEWPAGTRLYPARAAHMADGRGFQDYTGAYSRGIARFKTLEECARTVAAETEYRGRPIMVSEPNWRQPPGIDHDRLLSIIDYGTGRDTVFDKSDQAFPIKRALWSALDRDAADELLDFIWSRRGRQKSVWVPTWANDLTGLSYEDATRLLDVRFCGLVSVAAGNVHRKDIRIELTDGTVHYRRLGALSTPAEGSIERAELDTALGADLEAADFKRISWLMLMRLEQDAIEISWHSPAVAESVMTFKGPKHGV